MVGKLGAFQEFRNFNSLKFGELIVPQWKGYLLEVPVMQMQAPRQMMSIANALVCLGQQYHTIKQLSNCTTIF